MTLSENRHARRVDRALLLLLLPLTTLASAAQAQYDFFVLESEIANPGPIVEPSINDAGTAIFPYRHDFSFNDLTTNTAGGSPSILYEGTFTLLAYQVPVINISGLAAWVGTRSGNTEVLSGNGGAVTTIADRLGPLHGFSNHIDMNDAGTVVFHASTDVLLGQVIQTGSGGALTTIADNTTTFSQFGPRPSINTAGTVAFWADTSMTGTSDTGLYTGNGGAITTLYDESGIFDNFFAAPDINDSGNVAFKAQLDTTAVQGIFVGDGDPPTTLVDDSGLYAGFQEHAMNNSGNIVFLATLDATGPAQGLYTGPDPVADKVIAEGDALGGGTVIDIVFYHGFNNVGDIVFGAIIDPGGSDPFISRVYLARPTTTAVPVLSGVIRTLVVAGLLAAAYVALARRRNRANAA